MTPCEDERCRDSPRNRVAREANTQTLHSRPPVEGRTKNHLRFGKRQGNQLQIFPGPHPELFGPGDDSQITCPRAQNQNAVRCQPRNFDFLHPASSHSSCKRLDAGRVRLVDPCSTPHSGACHFVAGNLHPIGSTWACQYLVDSTRRMIQSNRAAQMSRAGVLPL